MHLPTRDLFFFHFFFAHYSGSTCTDQHGIFHSFFFLHNIQEVRQFPVQGRRAVDFSVLTKGLESCVNMDCGQPLLLSPTALVGEHRFGLASILSIACSSCGHVNSIETDKRFRPAGQQRGPSPFSINEKLALGMSAMKLATTVFFFSGGRRNFFFLTCVISYHQCFSFFFFLSPKSIGFRRKDKTPHHPEGKLAGAFLQPHMYVCWRIRTKCGYDVCVCQKMGSP